MLIFSLSQEVLAWGPEGHRIVGEIAQMRLLPKVKRKIRGEFDIRSLANVAHWADEVKKRRSEKPWHYANIKKGERTYNQKRDCPDKQCVTEKIKDFMKALAEKNLSRKKKREAVKYLVHFVADVHQPLHLGNARDRGGNNIDVFFRGKRTNLHALWDGGLIIRNGKSLIQYARELKCKVDGEFTLSHNPVVKWANESRKLALENAYSFTLTPRGELTPEYIRKSREIIDRQLCRAGIRLANLLNQVLFADAF